MVTDLGGLKSAMILTIAINPDATELWNGVDDNCNDVIDDGVNRYDYIAFTSLQNSTINATEDKLLLSMDLDLSEADIENIGLEFYWYRNSILLSTNTLLRKAHSTVRLPNLVSVEFCAQEMGLLDHTISEQLLSTNLVLLSLLGISVILSGIHQKSLILMSSQLFLELLIRYQIT